MSERSDDGRFKRGHTGNRKGRPRKKRLEVEEASPLQVLLGQEIALSDGRSLSLKDAAMQKALEDAFAGSRKARRKVVQALTRREMARRKAKSKRVAPVELKREGEDGRNADDAMLLLGIVRRHDRREAFRRDAGRYDPSKVYLELESWAVQAALDRRRGAEPYSAQDLDSIKRQTFDADKVNWPEPSP